MSGHGMQDLRIEPVPVVQRPAALELLLRPLPVELRPREADRLLRLAAEGRLSFSGLFGARRAGELLGVVWAQVQPGRTAVIWTPQVNEAGDGVGGRLVLAAVEFAAVENMRLAQALLAGRDVPEARWFDAAGLRFLTDLDYLVCLLTDSTPPDAGQQGLAVVPYREPHDRRRLEELLTQTSRETQDCPALDGARRPADVLAGYRSSGDSGTKHWYLLAQAGRDIGCLLLADQPADDQFEVVYLGLVPELRGRGLGRAAVAQAGLIARAAGRRRLTLAVDASNAPAQATYGAAGFVRWDRRSLWVRVFPETRAASDVER